MSVEDPAETCPERTWRFPGEIPDLFLGIRVGVGAQLEGSRRVGRQLAESALSEPDNSVFPFDIMRPRAPEAAPPVPPETLIAMIFPWGP